MRYYFHSNYFYVELEEGYHTIAQSGTSLFKDRNSKFYGFAFQVKSKKDIQEHLDELKHSYADAGHHVYAYVLEDELFSTDDGEPKNSSGPPMLRQIQAFKLQQVLVVGIRYFGGKKLGIPGLINAYGECAKLALEEAGRTYKEWQDELLVTGPVAEEYKIYNLASRLGLRVEPKPAGGGILIKSNPKMTADFTREVSILGKFDCTHLGRK